MFGWLTGLRSFGDKLTWLLTLTSGGAIVAVCLVLAVFDYVYSRSETIAALELQTMIVGMNSGAPLAFGDLANGEEALAAFQARPGVVEATLYDAGGQPFARYQRTNQAAPQLPLQVDGTSRDGRWLVLVRSIDDRDQRLGHLQVVYDMARLHARLQRSLALSVLVTLITVTLVFLFSRRIKDLLMQPIAALGATARAISQTRDYSLRADKRSEDELGIFTDTFNEMLSQIQAQEIDLQGARQDAEAASRLKDEFLATLSHELRTPLTPILGWAQILHRLAGDDPRLNQAADVIERNARTQAQIVDDLLDMSRIISGKLKLDARPIELSAVIDAALDTVDAAATAKGIRIERQYAGSPPRLRGDPHRLQQVLWNLLSNAIKFSERGGWVRVELDHSDDHVEIIVSDSGQGISREFLPHVFERFRQADSSTTRAHGGLGIGLAIARQLIELHGGSIRAASAGPGAGASFSVLLPLSPPTGTDCPSADEALPDRREAPVGDALPSLAGLRLLLVQEDADARERIAGLLRDAGAEVLEADSAPTALQTLATQRPDLLLSDLGISSADGVELIRQIRRLPADRGGRTPAVALTVFARSEERGRALLAGYQLHVGKPVDPTELVAAIASVTGRAAGARS
jgi:signal transduction histidine kinase/ActR/RegA family two-component response regulator